jgi:MarR family transcriptional regulator for hemolysin
MNDGEGKVRSVGKAGRALHKRGPKAAARRSLAPKTRAEAPAKPRVRRVDPETHLLNYRKHFSDSSANEQYFRATRAIVTVARRWRKLANERLGAIGQTMARWETLFLVAFSDDGLTQGELARIISVEGPTVVRMLDLLAKKGMITRRQSAIDRRVTTNRITPKGMREIGNIMTITDELRRKILDTVDPQRLSVCTEVLHEILQHINTLNEEKS